MVAALERGGLDAAKMLTRFSASEWDGFCGLFDDPAPFVNGFEGVGIESDAPEWSDAVLVRGATLHVAVMSDGPRCCATEGISGSSRSIASDEVPTSPKSLLLGDKRCITWRSSCRIPSRIESTRMNPPVRPTPAEQCSTIGLGPASSLGEPFATALLTCLMRSSIPRLDLGTFKSGQPRYWRWTILRDGTLGCWRL